MDITAVIVVILGVGVGIVVVLAILLGIVAEHKNSGFVLANASKTASVLV